MLLVKAKLLQLKASVNHQFMFELDEDSLADFYISVPSDIENLTSSLVEGNALAVAKLPELDFVGLVIITEGIKAVSTRKSSQEPRGAILQVLTDSQSKGILKKIALDQLKDLQQKRGE